MAAGAPAAPVQAEVTLNAQSIVELRRVRLHHWRLVLEASARMSDRRCSRHSYEQWKRQHHEHMLMVQALNSVFPVGDTADRDREHVARFGALPGETLRQMIEAMGVPCDG